MVNLADAAVTIAEKQSHHAAVEFLFARGCPPGTIDRILASSSMYSGSINQAPESVHPH
jgi:hypothetical protein